MFQTPFMHTIQRRFSYAVHVASGNGAQQLRFQDKLALLVLLASLVRLVVFPADSLLALPAVDIADYVAASRHIALIWIRLGDVDDAIEQVCFAVLATKVLHSVSATLQDS